MTLAVAFAEPPNPCVNIIPFPSTAPRGYRHLSWTQRLQLEAALRANPKITQTELAALIGVHQSTVSRELRRGVYLRRDGKTWIEHETYSPDISQNKYEANLHAKGCGRKLLEGSAFANFLETKMAEENFSPQAALAIAEASGVFAYTLSKQTVYDYIRKGVFPRLTLEHLPRSGGRKKRYKKVVRAARAPRGLSIEVRPEPINDRAEFGHWEIDTVEGRKPSKACLLVLTERKTREELIEPIPAQIAAEVVRGLRRIRRRFGANAPRIFRSLTSDNGKEFADTAGMQSFLGKRHPIEVYTCHPRNPQERGSNENANTFIRRKQFFPKGSTFKGVPRERIQAMEDWINAYPRGIFGGKSAWQMFEEEVAKLE